jgi:hypothetical protein
MLPIPPDVLRSIPSRIELDDHGIAVDCDRWRSELTRRGLPEPAGPLADPGGQRISRGELFALGDADPTASDAIQLLYNSLAWGLGGKAPWLGRRLNALQRESETFPQLLLAAWQLVRGGTTPQVAYEALVRDNGSGRIAMLGPAFATKFLYFAQGNSSHNIVILDRVLARSVRKAGWSGLKNAGWTPTTYAKYADLIARWAAEAAAHCGESVEPDQVEHAIFHPRPATTPK